MSNARAVYDLIQSKCPRVQMASINLCSSNLCWFAKQLSAVIFCDKTLWKSAINTICNRKSVLIMTFQIASDVSTLIWVQKNIFEKGWKRTIIKGLKLQEIYMLSNKILSVKCDPWWCTMYMSDVAEKLAGCRVLLRHCSWMVWSLNTYHCREFWEQSAAASRHLFTVIWLGLTCRRGVSWVSWRLVPLLPQDCYLTGSYMQESPEG